MKQLGIDIESIVGFPMSKHHGSPYDRGNADSYYQRGSRPHYYGGEAGGPYGGSIKFEQDQMTDQQIKEYEAGYNDNEKDANFKDW